MGTVFALGVGGGVVWWGMVGGDDGGRMFEEFYAGDTMDGIRAGVCGGGWV